MTVSVYCEPGLLDKLLNYRYYVVTPLFVVYLHIAVEGPNLQVRAGVLQMPPPSSPTWSPRSSQATFAPNAYADPTRILRGWAGVGFGIPTSCYSKLP